MLDSRCRGDGGGGGGWGVRVLRRRKVTGKAGVRHAVADYKTRGGSNSGPAPFALAPLPLIG